MAEFWESAYISDLLLVAYVITLGLAWIAMILNVENWGKAWRVRRPEKIPEEGEMLSICVPARNEAENIGACVEHALQSRWPNFELLVVDDRSSDATGSVASCPKSRLAGKVAGDWQDSCAMVLRSGP